MIAKQEQEIADCDEKLVQLQQELVDRAAEASGTAEELKELGTAAADQPGMVLQPECVYKLLADSNLQELEVKVQDQEVTAAAEGLAKVLLDGLNSISSEQQQEEALNVGMREMLH